MKNKLIVGAVIIAILIFAFWYGGDAPNSRGWETNTTQAVMKTEAPTSATTASTTVATKATEIATTATESTEATEAPLKQQRMQPRHRPKPQLRI